MMAYLGSLEFTWVHLGLLGFTWVQLGSIKFTWVHFCSLVFTRVNFVFNCVHFGYLVFLDIGEKWAKFGTKWNIKQAQDFSLSLRFYQM